MAGLVMTGANPANAASTEDHFSFSFYYPPGVTDVEILVTNRTKGIPAGYADFIADGDIVVAHDSGADGYGIEAHLKSSPPKIASTRGHSAPYTDADKRDLPENHSYQFWVCAVNGNWSSCSDTQLVVS
ncbi:hypothetical protein ACF1BE_34775 [Streptomyces sp. NPDC014991]|uniref:hypothetical protein n=1 Tax=Streptomyces sp. NPDC014991 TaxID=3364935 RepID=UPI00370305DE